jgi:hypothetical protein
MDTFFQTPLTHAYLLPTSVFEKAIEELQFLSTTDSAELLQLEFSRLGVEESHLVQNIATIHSPSGKKYVVIFTGDITPDAQHSLLKLLEEPPVGVHFFIFVHQPHTLLATLKSRCVPIGLFLEEEGNLSTAKKFIALPLKDKFTAILKMNTKHEDDEDNVLLKQEADTLLGEVIMVLSKTKDSSTLKKIDELLSLKKHMYEPGSMPKQLLETMAMLIS